MFKQPLYKGSQAMDEISSNLKQDLEAIDNVIADRKIAIERGVQLSRLRKNTDFIDVVLNGYITAEEAKLFKILTNPSGASPYSQEHIMLKLSAISDFKGYIGTEDYKGSVEIMADNAPLEIAREELYRKEITAAYAEGL